MSRFVIITITNNHILILNLSLVNYTETKLNLSLVRDKINELIGMVLNKISIFLCSLSSFLHFFVTIYFLNNASESLARRKLKTYLYYLVIDEYNNSTDLMMIR